MKYLFIQYLILIVSTSCTQSQQQVDEVKGYKIKYKISVSSDYNEIKNRLKSQNPLGDTMELSIANGYYKQVFPTSNTTKSIYYNYVNNYQYQSLRGRDTINYLNCNTEKRILIEELINNEYKEILDYKCDCSTIKAENITYKFCYTNEFPLNIQNFKNHNWGFFNKIMSIGQGPYLYFELIYPTYTVSYKALKIENANFDSSNFFPSSEKLNELKI